MAIISAGTDPQTGEQLFIDTEAASPEALTLAEIKQDISPLSNLADIEPTKAPATGQNLQPITAPEPIQLPTVSRQQAQFRGDVAAGLTTGLQLTAQPAGVTDPFALESVSQVGTAVALGFLLGGPAGGLTALAVGGLNAFLNSRSEKRKRKAAEKSVKLARKAEKERIAREDRWRRVNRLDALEAQRFSRKQAVLQSEWAGMQSLNNSMMNLLNTNQNLKERFARLGF